MSDDSLTDARQYLRQLAPHIKTREGPQIVSRLIAEVGQLLKEQVDHLAEIERLKALLQSEFIRGEALAVESEDLKRLVKEVAVMVFGEELLIRLAEGVRKTEAAEAAGGET